MKIYRYGFLLIILLFGCVPSKSTVYKEHYPSGKLKVLGARYYAGSLCGNPIYELTGKLESWYENGQLKTDSHFSKGECVGLSKVWYENGNLKHMTNWRNGELEGAFSMYYDNGVISSKGVYVDSKPRELRFYDKSNKMITLLQWRKIGTNKDIEW